MRMAILTTGGTIDKTYDETDGSLANVNSVLEHILTGLRLPDTKITHIPVMSKDSLDLTDADRETILFAVKAARAQNDAVVVVHGTDTLERTGEYLCAELQSLSGPVVLTGAMRPYEFRDTDAVQNITEAVLAARLLDPGVWVVMHSQALRFPGARKDRATLTFVRDEGA